MRPDAGRYRYIMHFGAVTLLLGNAMPDVFETLAAFEAASVNLAVVEMIPVRRHAVIDLCCRCPFDPRPIHSRLRQWRCGAVGADPGGASIVATTDRRGSGLTAHRMGRLGARSQTGAHRPSETRTPSTDGSRSTLLADTCCGSSAPIRERNTPLGGLLAFFW